MSNTLICSSYITVSYKNGLYSLTYQKFLDENQIILNPSITKTIKFNKENN